MKDTHHVEFAWTAEGLKSSLSTSRPWLVLGFVATFLLTFALVLSEAFRAWVGELVVTALTLAFVAFLVWAGWKTNGRTRRRRR
jgi:hypothetical protein